MRVVFSRPSACSLPDSPVIDVDNVRFGGFVEPVFPIGAADSRLTATRVKALHRLEVFPIDVRFPELQIAHRLHRFVEVFGAGATTGRFRLHHSTATLPKWAPLAW